ncbi:MAG: hypothetical protein GWN29_05035 [Gammaproteobacteria bacterium]|nr:hypothetical protein [Gammaproteobacteria bacterium]NIV51118.1 hypothetical protein [Gammaproteobacteria bacterium]NIW23971.1 hypothetical protein [Gammaproteobacteria bacterium]NIX85059.1 hypothetical protein [Gammaproteobacteria bacterium]
MRFFAVPNGASLGRVANRYAYINRLKREGLLAGAPDLVLVDLAPVDCRPVMVEVKRQRGGGLSTMQVAMRDIAEGAQWHHVLARGCADGAEKLERLGFVERWWVG